MSTRSNPLRFLASMLSGGDRPTNDDFVDDEFIEERSDAIRRDAIRSVGEALEAAKEKEKKKGSNDANTA